MPHVLRWLYTEFMENKAVYSQYSFGVVDYSRILYLFIYIYRSNYRGNILQKSELVLEDVITAIHSLATHIDKEKVIETVSVYSDNTKSLRTEEIVNWGDCFITAEICETMCQYLIF